MAYSFKFHGVPIHIPGTTNTQEAASRGKLLPGPETEDELKDQLMQWIGAVTQEKVGGGDTFEKSLKDGVLLCKLMNKVLPGSVKKINTKGGNFTWMENMAALQKAMKAYGVPENELFQSVDLTEGRNIRAVVQSLCALARLCFNKGFDGPSFGPKMATESLKMS